MITRRLWESRKLVLVLLAIALYLAAGWMAYTIYEGISPDLADALFPGILVIIPIFLVMLSISIWPNLIIRGSLGEMWLERHTDAIDAMPDALVGLGIALAAGLSLYAELMIIRVHSSYFQLFAYFKNLSLLSCFLGLGIGYARGSRRPLTTPLTLPFLAVEIIFMYIMRASLFGSILQNPISEQLTLGMEQASKISGIIIVYAFLALIFTFNALCFVPLGQLTARLMMRRQTLVAYSWNLIGSLLGILLFSFVSFVWTPPSIWILIVALAIMAFLWKDVTALLPTGLAIIVILVSLAAPLRLNRFDTYSPYQILTLVLSKDHPPILETSNAYYQKILDLSEKNIQNNEYLRQSADYYTLPYLFKPKPQHVLVVGSGTGNDVAAGLRNGAGEIDAVEIDPAILQFGRQLHPESPYQARTVNAVVDDARAFVRYTDKQYDLIVYGLLDSHILLSGTSGGIRLDSYVYTVEGLREARQKLKGDGIINLTFSILNKDLGRKLFLMLQQAFDGKNPKVFQTGYDGGYTFLAGAELERASLHLPPTLREVTDQFDDNAVHTDVSTDDWPFFYMPIRKYPLSYVVMILVLLSISLLLIRRLVPGSGGDFSVPCFFLGAGFMLVETKGITELALVYGSTWIVISAVITAILILGFMANLAVMKLGTPSPLITYSALFISLIVGLGLTYTNLAGFAPWLSRAIMTLVLTFPLFFSGFAFSTELRRSTSVAVALSGNLLGAMLGGFLEYNSMYFGFRSLYIFALVVYGFAFWGSMRIKRRKGLA